jgi:hypothetical protein
LLDVLSSFAAERAGAVYVTAGAQMLLLNSPNPYILHGDQAGGYPWYLSVDIRVFQMVADGTTKKFAESNPGQR